MSDSNTFKGNAAIVQMVLFCTFLSSMGMLLLFLPKEEVDAEENRNLVTYPACTPQNLYTGAYMDSIDLYAADHFPFRKSFLNLSFFIKNIRGIQSQRSTFHADVQAIDEELAANTQETLVQDEETKNSKGLLVLDGQGYQIFNPTYTQKDAYASTINAFYKKCKDSIPIYNLIVPTPVEFMLPSSYKEYKGVDLATIKSLESALHPRVNKVSVFDEFFDHRKEYLFYRTDHHWTALGAYYAYVSFCRKKGIVPVTLEGMKEMVLPGKFLGTHYLKTKDKRLLSSPDVIHYWIPSVEAKALKYSQNKTSYVDVYKTKDISINKYLVFLGGDHPNVLLSSSKIKNGKTLLIIKNSYGNPLAPYFVQHYEKVCVMDYRYTKEKVVDMVKRFNVDDILIVNSIFSANAPTHLKMLRQIIE